MIRSSTLMCEYFGINNFYYTTTTLTGLYSGFGTHIPWLDYFCENFSKIGDCPFLRHPSIAKPGVYLLKNTSDNNLKRTITTAWDEYQINYTLNILLQIPEGFESFGFGLKSAHPKAEENLLNELPLIKKFILQFREENRKLIAFNRDHQIEVMSLLNRNFYNEPSNICASLHKRELLLKQLGLEAILALTTREIDILKFMANGFPASYIAKKLHLSRRTVENYTATIKSKLDCNSKVDLIQRAQEMVSIINPV